ncbi:G-protein coupled receptor 12-like [Protobothrops mucrosquamatus]|uniref:G-protein coupled receptor 12-like n=1 Tax=Protobothrops mucrosquamatus TaxID=103944 RepID=UPI000775EF57|nr:G-protein coupled receptor 12-like [Protobothrops mucrosquamatus]
MFPIPAAAMEEQFRQQQQQRLLVLFNASSWPLASLWPPTHLAAAAAGSPAVALSPGATASAGGEGSGPGGGAGGEAAAAGGAVSPWDIALCAAGTLMAGENALVLAVLFYAPGLRAPPFLLIGSLALADLLAGLGLVVNFGVHYLLQPPSEAARLSAAGLLLAAFSASVGSLLAITVDRYLSLSNALTYHSERTRTFTGAGLLLLWLACLAVGLLPLLGWNCLRRPGACSVLRPVTRDNAAVLAVAFLLVFGLMLQLYGRICRIACRHAQQIAVQHQFMASAQATSTRKGLSTLSLILGTFALCWVPFAVYCLVADASYPEVYTYSLALPAACHSLLNPVVYAFRNPEIQKSLWLACCACIPGGFASRPRTSSDV